MLPEGQELAQTVILSVITRVFGAKSQKCVKVTILDAHAKNTPERQTSTLPPRDSHSRLIKGHLDRLTPDHCPIPSFCVCDTAVILP